MIRIELRRTVFRGLAFGGAALAMLAAAAGVAQAHTYTVATTSDPVNTPCPSQTSPCSLRQILLYIDSNPFTPDVVNVPAGMYLLTSAYGSLPITQNVSIVGGGARLTTVAAAVPNPPFSNRATQGNRVFNITGTPTVSISGMTITGGTAVQGL